MKTHTVLRSTLLLMLALGPALSASGAPSGPLSFVQTVRDTGLDGADAVALSPDERYLYVSSYGDSAVTVFRRDDASGRLAFVEVIRDGDGGANALGGLEGVAVSPDGGQVYVTASVDGALTVFSRAAATGRLTYLETHQDGVGGIVSLGGAVDVVVSPDGKNVYVASDSDDAVSAFSRDAHTGALTFVDAEGPASGLDGTASVAISPDGQHVYAANYHNDTVAIFGRKATSGELAYLGSVQDESGVVDGLNGASAVTVSDDGANVYVAGREDNAVAAFRRDAASGALTFVDAKFDGAGGANGLAGAVAVAVSHDGAHVYVAGADDRAVAIFGRNGTTGALKYAGMAQTTGSGWAAVFSPYWMTLDQGGHHVYVANRAGAVEVFGRDDGDGSLAHIEQQGTAPGLEGAAGAAVSGDGECVYVTGYDIGTVAFFSRDPASGELTYIEADWAANTSGLNGAIGVAASPDGANLYVAGYDDDAVVAFEVFSVCGARYHLWTYDAADAIDGLDGARSLVVSPDGAHVYVASSVDDALAIFDRDAEEGELLFRQAVFDGDAGGAVDGLGGAYSVAVSPDGADIYVAGYNDDAVAIFRWVGPSLNYRGMVKDGVGGVDGLNGANSVAVSPDGRHVYVAGRNDHAVAIFSRAPSDGGLTFEGVMKDGVAGVDGLYGARAVALSPDGRWVYVAGQLDDALAVFNRSSNDGSLTFAEAYKDGAGGVDGLNTAIAVAVSPDGKTIYATGYDDDAIAVFARNWEIYLPLALR